VIVMGKSCSLLRFVVLLGLSGSIHGGDLLPSAAAEPPASRRTVYLARNLSEENLITFSAHLTASDPSGILLLDDARTHASTKHFLTAYQPEQLASVGAFVEEVPALEERLGMRFTTTWTWARGPPLELWKAWFPRAEHVVVCPAEPRGLLLQAACLAGVLRAPLFVLHELDGELDLLQRQLSGWQTRTVYLAGPAARLERQLASCDKVVTLADPAAVQDAYLQAQLRQGPIATLVVANPHDAGEGKGAMSTLAPWVALQRRAALLLTSEDGTNATAVIRAALKDPRLAAADALLLVANLRAIPMERRPNPVEGGKDPFIEMEPFTPTGSTPFTFATGRLFHAQRNVVLLMLARPHLLPPARSPRQALLIGNPAGDLPLLELFSRNLGKELHNSGYRTTTRFNDKADRDEVRKLLPQQDLFIWQGHHETLVTRWGVPSWPEPLRPALVFLESCMALCEPEALPFLERGALGVIGTSTRTYSGSGGAFTLGFFDGLFYDQQSLGGSLRQAKNFLLAYSILKEKRLGDQARLKGANLRSAWAFSLWGDPTLHLPPPERPGDALPAVRHQVQNKTFTVTLPDQAYSKVSTEKYQVQLLPNGRLAGLVTKEETEDGRHVIMFVFAEVHLSQAPAGKVPRLTSRLPEKNWVFTWDARRQCGYLVLIPRARDGKNIRFQVEWQEQTEERKEG
jgi:hypothetical protein